MIRNRTARELLYAWHGGMSSPFYAAASSGLVKSFADLALECDVVDIKERSKLLTWLSHQQQRCPRVSRGGVDYFALPWA